MDVVCLGIIVADVMGKTVERMPEPGKLEIFEQMELHPGGCAVNTAIGLHKLGIKARVMGKVGKDVFAEFILEKLKGCGVDTSGIKYAEKKSTSFTFAAINKRGERAFFHYTGANEELRFEDVDFGLIEGCKIFHVAGFYLMPQFDGEPVARVLQEAKKYRVTITLDTAWNSKVKNWQELIEPSRPYVDVILPAIEEARMFSKREKPADIASYLLSRGVKIVAIKMGGQGCYVKDGEQEFYLPAYPVEAVDTSGAGDAFVAGFLTGMIKGWSLRRTAEFANAVGALCVQDIGCTAGIKSLKETLSFMKKYSVDPKIERLS